MCNNYFELVCRDPLMCLHKALQVSFQFASTRSFTQGFRVLNFADLLMLQCVLLCMYRPRRAVTVVCVSLLLRYTWCVSPTLCVGSVQGAGRQPSPFPGHPRSRRPQQADGRRATHAPGACACACACRVLRVVWLRHAMITRTPIKYYY